MTRLQDLAAEWATRRTELQAIADDYIAPINAWAKANEIDYVRAPE